MEANSTHSCVALASQQLSGPQTYTQKERVPLIFRAHTSKFYGPSFLGGLVVYHGEWRSAVSRHTFHHVQYAYMKSRPERKSRQTHEGQSVSLIADVLKNRKEPGVRLMHSVPR